MIEINFTDLIEIYRHTDFHKDKTGTLYVSSNRVYTIINTANTNNDFYEKIQISSDVHEKDFNIGDKIEIFIASPSPSLGFLLEDYDNLFKLPGATFHEPKNYFIIKEKYASTDKNIPSIGLDYKVFLKFMKTLKDSAFYVDEHNKKLVFANVDKVIVSISLSSVNLTKKFIKSAQRLEKNFQDEIHLDEKLSFLSSSIIETVKPKKIQSKFFYIMQNLDHICDSIENDYKLFISSFSYSKIRNDIESTRIEFINKIHKTINDIQSQLLGIPIASIVVASQMKPVKYFGMQFWLNASVLLGVFIFITLLYISIRNQWNTLSVLHEEIDRQKKQLKSNYKAISDQFLDQFNDLYYRINWHKKALVFILAISIIGFFISLLFFFYFIDFNIIK